jgi:hypothetical protein
VDKRPPIPSGMKRSIRQRCGFGCVVCGLPIYEYEHIDGWANTKQHEEDRIVLLCKRHHHEKTNGLLPGHLVEEFSESPLNLRSGESTPYSLWFSGERYEFDVGTNTFTGLLSSYGIVQPVRIDGTGLLSARLEDNHYMLTLHIADEGGREVLTIVDNELTFSALVYDVELVGHRLILRDGYRKILIDIEFQPPAGVKIRRGRFLRNGIELLVTENWSSILNSRTLLSGNSAENCWIGLAIGRDSKHIVSAYRSGDVTREGWDRRGAIRWARERAREMQDETIDEIAGLGPLE